ncbi:MAG: 16S rRNA (uracil(1498)-N(3))-methyltransferase [Acidimicrobiales bacterium]|nr:16S rRNA (uracil(1498)-N(3))-methyltransferase [Acidimicrobiales bacterium]HRW39607.1 RsmE family RNA methyltransferase [Aquihabitans sp.]
MAGPSLPDGAVPSDGGPLAFVDDLDRPVLADDDHHHLARVRRVRDGEALVLADGRGSWRPARMAGATPEPVGEVVVAAPPAPAIGVGFALVKGSKPELAVQKLTELGVDRIVPFAAARSVVRWDAAKAAAAQVRLAKVAREAAAQSRRPWLPEVAEVATFAVAAAEPGAALAERGGEPVGLHHPFVLVGPEGGWSDDERDGRPHVALGPGVLRAETAAIVAGALLVALRAGVVSPGREAPRVSGRRS